ncbi:hypothetical protein K2X85_08060 [bacterium]|nr:hypothetical protein [bacterium]
MVAMLGLVGLVLWGADAPRQPTPAVDEPLVLLPEKVEAGQSVVVQTAEPSECVWQVQPAGTRWISGRGEQGSFVALLDLTPGRYFVSCVSFEKRRHQTLSIDVADTPHPPRPDPSGRFGLIKEAADWAAAAVPAEHRGQSRELARSFRAVQSAIVAGAIKDPAAILRETLASNNLALGSHIDAWRPWGIKLEARLSQLHRESKLRTPSDYAEAWGEIATGLDAVGGK